MLLIEHGRYRLTRSHAQTLMKKFTSLAFPACRSHLTHFLASIMNSPPSVRSLPGSKNISLVVVLLLAFAVINMNIMWLDLRHGRAFFDNSVKFMNSPPQQQGDTDSDAIRELELRTKISLEQFQNSLEQLKADVLYKLGRNDEVSEKYKQDSQLKGTLDGFQNSLDKLKEELSTKTAETQSKSKHSVEKPEISNPTSQATTTTTTVDLSKCTFYGQEHKDAIRQPNGSVEWKYTGRPDEHVFNMLFKSPLKRNGVFLEMGALDGKLYSNSLFFEECLGWTGLLIEAQEQNYAQLIQNRPNPDIIKLRSAVCEQEGYIEFIGVGSAGGAVESMTEQSLKAFSKHWGQHNKVQKVPCKSMKDILKENSITEIDFFSLDVEGAEPIVLKTIDFNAVDIKLLMMEYNVQCSKIKPSCEELLLNNGFYMAGTFSVNRLYLNNKFFPQNNS